MAEQNTWTTLLASLTTPRGAMIAVPALLGAALVFSIAGSNDLPAAKVAGATSSGEQLPPKTARIAKPEPVPASNSAVKLAAATTKKASPDQLFTAEQRKEIGAIVREYLIANPEVLVEVTQELERRRKEREDRQRLTTLESEKNNIYRSPLDYVLGNEKGDITVVEYFDYNCGWCKRALDEVIQLAEKDKRVRIVMKEFPIFGADSTFAAKAAMASKPQGKYWDFHVALMKAERVTASNTLDIAKGVGIDIDALKKEMAKPIYDQAIAETTRIATALGMQGTPAFIVDSKVNFGYVPIDGLRTMLSEIREKGCKIC